MINHDIIRIFNEVRISSFPCDIVINDDIIRILNEVKISSSFDIVINFDIIRIFNEVSPLIGHQKEEMLTKLYTGGFCYYRDISNNHCQCLFFFVTFN